MEDRYEMFTVLITGINRNIKRLKTEQMAEYSLKGLHVTCLHYLYRFSPMTAAELRDRCDEDKAAVSRALSYLEENGFIRTECSTAKKYKTPIVLTDKGMAVGKEISLRITEIVKEATHSLSEEDSSLLYRTLNTIASNLDRIGR